MNKYLLTHFNLMYISLPPENIIKNKVFLMLTGDIKVEHRLKID